MFIVCEDDRRLVCPRKEENSIDEHLTTIVLRELYTSLFIV